ncbi:MAG: hypothetical protein CMG62_02780 [Candidatus Marinimicrobia bacterium]|nr:hypothetical protein [Candidatus Neomarinimicrobiota bacterium]|tara:strand:+ start:189 stop:1025 length:837 start_codon:yes stop_codon:yes gene_type:complete
MYPVIIDFGNINIFGFEFHLAIYSFGFMLVVAFYSCYFLLEKDLKRTGYDKNLASDIVFWAALGGVIGAKVYYLIENFDRVIIDPRGMIFSGSGLVFLGGLLGGLLGVTMVLKKNKLPWLIFADLVAPLLILGYGVGRIGCFLVGDDYGLPSKLPWAISFPDGLPPTNSQSFELYYPWIDISKFSSFIITVHPTQIYETLFAFAIFYYLWINRLKIQINGELFFKYLILAGIERFFIEFIRTNPKYLFDLFSGAQIISFSLILIGFYFTIYPIGKSET